MHRYKFFIITFLLFVCSFVDAQEFNDFQSVAVEMDEVVNKKMLDTIGVVSITQDVRVEELLRTDSIINSKNPGFSGYRVQIFSGKSTDKEKAFEVKKQFSELFPNERAYVVYQAPDFRVRVGNFRTKLESIELYKACVKYFPNCYPVKTMILFSDLKPIDTQDEELILDVKE